MSDLFSFDARQAVAFPEMVALRRDITDPGRRGLRIPTSLESVAEGVSESNLGSQFVLFQLTDDGIVESATLQPKLDGSADEPDVRVELGLESFNVGANETVDRDESATIRLVMGKDESSRDRYFDSAFWCITAGLKLWDEAKNTRSQSKDLESNFRKSLGNRPIDIPGALSLLTFEVIKHKSPPWWKQIFKFLESGSGQTLTSALGFPALTNSAIRLIDGALDRLTDAQPEVLFKSRPLKLALTKQAQADFTGGSSAVSIGALNPGFAILARYADLKQITAAKARYDGTYRVLVPVDAKPGDVQAQGDNPFGKLTYAVIRVGMTKAKLDPRFVYG